MHRRRYPQQGASGSGCGRRGSGDLRIRSARAVQGCFLCRRDRDDHRVDERAWGRAYALHHQCSGRPLPKEPVALIKAMARLGPFAKSRMWPRTGTSRNGSVEQSGLNWTIVKPSELMAENERPRFVHGEDLLIDAYSRISRYHLSSFLLDHLEADNYPRKKVFLRY